MKRLKTSLAIFGEDGKPLPSARRVAQQLGVGMAELAALIGMARNTLSTA